MESIDSYMQRKTKQMDTYRASVKELKVPPSFHWLLPMKAIMLMNVVILHIPSISLFRIFQTKPNCSKLMAKPEQWVPSPRKPPEYSECSEADECVSVLQKANQSRPSILSPVPVNKRTTGSRRTLLSASKAPPLKEAPLKEAPLKEAPLKEAPPKAAAPFRPSVLSTRRINVRWVTLSFKVCLSGGKWCCTSCNMTTSKCDCAQVHRSHQRQWV